jgi:hypothetical protein
VLGPQKQVLGLQKQALGPRELQELQERAGAGSSAVPGGAR